jgi:hypothetical protein
MKNVILLLFLAGTIFTHNSAHATNIIVSGNVSGTWNVDTVKVIGDITVPSNSVLIIDPGVLVEFYGHYKITVKGNVLAIGNENNSIRFTVNDTTGFADTTNTSGGWHGFIYDNLDSSADSSKFIFCVFEYGKAVDSDSAGRYGGAFRIFNFSKIILTHCRFENNLAYHWGGAMYVKQSDITVQKSDFINNNCGQADIPYGYGGALCFVRSNPVVSYNHFEKNSSTGVGGAASFEYSDAEVRFNTFYKNKSGLGGALSFLRSDPVNVVSDNLLDQNEAIFFGGGIACIRANTNFVNNTIVNNISSYGGGFYANDSAFPANYNTIFYGNFAYEGIEVYIWDIYSAPDFYFCNVPGGKDGFSGSGGHEGYHGIYENNLDTIPMFIDTGDYPFALEKESPFVDAGTADTTALQIPIKDFAGNLRIYNNRIDIGAFEWNPGEGIKPCRKKNALVASPNPCSQGTTFYFSLKMPGKISLEIYDLKGKMIKNSGVQYFSAGRCALTWHMDTDTGDRPPTGVYLCRVTGDHFTESVKLVIMP